ncbi:MAG: hypothetical protein [Asgard archaea virus SkuldV2]|nr:MAG: hypothetical protein [Asgard archaea virus SkuldV2]
MSKYLERKIRIFFECFKANIDLDDLELIKESEIVNGVLVFPEKRRPKFRKMTSFFDTKKSEDEVDT